MTDAPRRQLYARLTSPRLGLSLSFDEVAQASHVAIAAAVVGLASARFHTTLAKFIGSMVVILFATVKEFWFDKTYEDPVTRGSDFEDWSYYLVGMTAALLILWGN